MADRYVSSLAVGGGAGTQPDPWTLAEAMVAINAGVLLDGETCWIKTDGVYTTTGITITSSGADLFKRLIGYNAVIGDTGRATIRRNGGAADLFFLNATSWRLQNLILDGQSGGTHVLRTVRRVEFVNIEAHHAGGGQGITSTYDEVLLKNCYSHDNVGSGIVHGFCYDCITEGNVWYGFWDTKLTEGCIGKNNRRNWDVTNLSLINNCISDGSTEHGIALTGAWAVVSNTVIINSPAAQYGLNFTWHNYAFNINFFGNVQNTNRPADVHTSYTLDPQFTAPASLDYTRSGPNLDDKGFSVIGLQAFDYGVDVGPDQRRTCTLPTVDQVQKGIGYVDHGAAKTGTLEAVSFILPMDVVVEDEELVVEISGDGLEVEVNV